MRLVVVLAVALVASGSQAQSVIDGSDKAIATEALAKLTGLLAQEVHDPRSIQIKNLSTHPRNGALCGSFNSKNAFGGYTDFRRFRQSAERLLIEPAGQGDWSAGVRKLIDELC